jgi:hypothetical protein
VINIPIDVGVCCFTALKLKLFFRTSSQSHIIHSCF